MRIMSGKSDKPTTDSTKQDAEYDFKLDTDILRSVRHKSYRVGGTGVVKMTEIFDDPRLKEPISAPSPIEINKPTILDSEIFSEAQSPLPISTMSTESKGNFIRRAQMFVKSLDEEFPEFKGNSTKDKQSEKVKCLFLPYYISQSNNELDKQMRKYHNLLNAPKLPEKKKKEIERNDLEKPKHVPKKENYTGTFLKLDNSVEVVRKKLQIKTAKLQKKLKSCVGAQLFKKHTTSCSKVLKVREPNFLKGVSVPKMYEHKKDDESSEDSMTPAEHLQQILCMI